MGTRPRVVSPASAPTDFTPWLTALAKVNYAGYVNPFMHGDLPPEKMTPALQKPLDYLKTTHSSLP